MVESAATDGGWPMARAGRLGPWYQRFAPRDLPGRIALATAALSLTMVAATFGVTYLVATGLLDKLAELSSEANLESFHQFVDVSARELQADAAGFASSEALYRQSLNKIDQDWGRARLEAPLRARHRSAVIAVVSSSGKVLYSSGRRGDVEVLRRAIGDTPWTSHSGVTWLSSGLGLVVSRPIVGTLGSTPRACLIVARPFGGDVATEFRPPTGTLRVELLPPAYGANAGETVAGFTNVTVNRSFDNAVTLATLPGIDGTPAGVARFRFEDPRTRLAATAGMGAATLAAILAGVLGAGYGIIIARAVQLPLDRTIRDIEHEGRRVLDGEAPGRVEVPDAAFEELRKLRAVVDELLAALSERQAELSAATSRAQESEQTIRSMADDSPEVKLLIQDGHVVHANPAAGALVQTPPHLLVGVEAATLLTNVRVFDEGGVPLGREDLARAMGSPLLVRAVTKGAPERWFEILVITHEESRDRALITARDVTEQRRLEAVREEILSLITHDLRAPLTVINGYLDILRRPLEDEARDRAIDAAKLNAEKMAGLLEDLLDVARAEELLAPRTLAPLDLGELAREVVSSLAPTAVGHKVVVNGKDRPLVLGEERRVRQAVVNLVTNALKYSPDGTTVTLHVSSGRGFGTLAVEDEGPGIPAAERKHVFDRYRRLAATAKGKPGLGLGLYIVRVIAENHGGGVRVEEARTGGARFVLDIPLAQLEDSAGAVAS